MKKSLFMSLALATMSVAALAGCSPSSGNKWAPMEGVIKVGIFQPNHPALEACVNGFKAVLNEKAAAGEFDLANKFEFKRWLL